MLSVVRGLPPPNVDDEAKEVRRSAIRIGNHFEEIGILMKHGVIDEAIFLDRYSWNIRMAWQLFGSFVASNRKVAGDTALFENFELLVVRAENFDRAHPSGYPAGVRRLNVESARPVPPAAPLQGNP